MDFRIAYTFTDSLGRPSVEQLVDECNAAAVACRHRARPSLAAPPPPPPAPRPPPPPPRDLGYHGDDEE